MKRLTKILSVFLVTALMFGSVAFASSSDNANVVSRIRQTNGGLADIAEQFLQAEASKGKTLDSTQADKIISYIDAAESSGTYAAARDGDQTAFVNLFNNYFVPALDIAGVSATYTKNADNKTVSIVVTDNSTGVQAGFTVGYQASVTATWVTPTVGPTAIDNSAFIVAAILGVLAIASTGFIAYRRRSTIA